MRLSFAEICCIPGKGLSLDKIIVYVNALCAVAAGFIRSMDNYFFHKFTQERRGQLCRFRIFLNIF